MTRFDTSFLTRKQPGWYEGIDETGTGWRVVQETSSKWAVLKGGKGRIWVDDFEANSLGEARLYVGGEVREATDPAYAARQARRRAARRVS